MGEPITIWSSGGGTQSNAIAIMILLGELPKPDIAIIVDTGHEVSTTWEYMEQHTRPALAKIGVNLKRVHKDEFATVDLYSKQGKLLVPAYTRDSADGSVGKLPTYCSNEWKGRVVQRYARSLYPKAKSFEMWMGMTMDEMNRIKLTTGKWVKKYPLVDARMFRLDAIRKVTEYGWPRPPKSTCYICPNKSAAHWKDLRDNHPKDFEAAAKLESELRSHDDAIFLHRQAVALNDVTFDDGQDDMFSGKCDTGHCFV